MRRVVAGLLLLALAACGTSGPRPVPTSDPADPGRADQWALDLLDPAANAWPTTRGDGVVVAVVDSGVDPTQPDLEGRVAEGIDLVEPDTPPDDTFGHGTHVAGIIAAGADNGLGIAGLAPDTTIVPVRVLDDDGNGTYDLTAEGIRWAVDHGADVVNLSLTLSRDDAGVRAAVQHAVEQGVVVVAAAGNDACPDTGANDPVFPAAYPGVVGVGALTESGNVPGFSACGDWVDLVAPGSGIVSVVPADARKTECVDNTGTCSLSGTSEAAPFVSAAAALALALPGADPTDVAERLASTAFDLDPPGRDDRSGAGRLDLAALLAD